MKLYLKNLRKILSSYDQKAKVIFHRIRAKILLCKTVLMEWLKALFANWQVAFETKIWCFLFGLLSNFSFVFITTYTTSFAAQINTTCEMLPAQTYSIIYCWSSPCFSSIQIFRISSFIKQWLNLHGVRCCACS